MLVLADDGQGGRVIEHVSESFGGEEAAADESGLLWVPEGIVVLVELRNDAVLEVLFGEILDDVVAVGEGLHVPPVAVAYFPIDHLDGNGSLLHLEVLLVVLLVLQHHLDAHGDVLLELLGN